MLMIENITKTFNPGTINSKVALSGLSLTVNDGDFITIIGANGAGKSTLFNAIRGKFITDSGRIVLDGEDITLKPDYIRAKNIGMLFQDPMLGTAPGMTIEENLALAAGRGGWLGRITKADREFFKERLSLLDMDLENRMDHPVGLLSGGQRQALTLMMATINKPKLLLLDEHTAALDPANAEVVMDLTRRFAEEYHLTVMMITHNMNHALSFGNRLLMMDSGEIILDVNGKEKENLTLDDIVERFRRIKKHDLVSDQMLLQ